MAAAAGRGPLVEGRADPLPVASGAAAAVCAAMALPVVAPLPDVLAEVKRILRPGGLLAALVPFRLGFPPRGWWSWARVFTAVGVAGQPWPNPDACDDLPARLAGHVPGVGAERIAAAQRTLGARARPGRRLPLPLRRVVARR
jgi:SAM-dependent methyltransferase